MPMCFLHLSGSFLVFGAFSSEYRLRYNVTYISTDYNCGLIKRKCILLAYIRPTQCSRCKAKLLKIGYPNWNRFDLGQMDYDTTQRKHWSVELKCRNAPMTTRCWYLFFPDISTLINPVITVIFKMNFFW